ncbi:MAG: hypothetical protein Q7K55_02555 [Candidatus Levybacteria bacterium]|nr:hypothetical protein [Candidatus Levybacteria bacterium]
MDDKTLNFIHKEKSIQNRNIFASQILIISISYALLTLWLNSIRANANIWFVWLLIIVQFLLYFSIFSVSYQRAKVLGLKSFGFAIFVILAILGRVENWEIIIIPITIIVMLILSFKIRGKYSN